MLVILEYISKGFDSDIGEFCIVHTSFQKHGRHILNATLLYYSQYSYFCGSHNAVTIVLDGYVNPENPEEIYLSKLIEYGGVNEVKEFINNSNAFVKHLAILEYQKKMQKLLGI